jgi:hypothetical protein
MLTNKNHAYRASGSDYILFLFNTKSLKVSPGRLATAGVRTLQIPMKQTV